MSKQHTIFIVLLVGVVSLLPFDYAFSAGILGFQPGDRSEAENDHWLKKSIGSIQSAIKEVEQGNAKESIKHGKTATASLKEIGSEGWAGRKQRALRLIRLGNTAAKKGEMEKATLKYQEAIAKLEGLKYGDLNFTHDAFLGIGDRR